MQAALSRLREMGAAGCVLLGDPAYYVRFGFKPMAGLTLPGVPKEYFQAVGWSALRPVGEVAYHPAFALSS
jgi:putative acetyltransferase